MREDTEFETNDMTVDMAEDDFNPAADGDIMADTSAYSRTGGRKSKAGQKKTQKEQKKHSQGPFIKKARPAIIAAAALIIGGMAGIGAYALSSIDENKVMDNVYVENLNVGGLTYSEALESIKATYLFENSEITLTDGTTPFTINGADIGLAAIPEETAMKAFDYCKTGNVFIDGFNASKLLFTSHVIVPSAQLDEERLDEKLYEAGNAMLGERIQHYIEIGEGDTAWVHSGQTGFDGDTSAAHEQVMNALAAERFGNIHVDFKTAPPDAMTIEALDLLIYKDPVNAQYEINGNDVTVTDGETGRYIDKDEVAPLVGNIYEGCEPVAVPFMISYPEVNADTLRAKLFANTLGSYSTSYGGSTWNRCQNVARAASLINGTVIAPGEVFSFNDTVGHRTKANGFYTAKEYINGESVDGIGGGTCQVSSTLYSAVLYADMGIVERLNHMMSVGYIPLGQDATVSDGGVDFRFRNTSEYPIKISAYTSGSTITVSIIGTAWEPARTVRISNSVTTVGENTVVYSTRRVYAGDELISTDTLNSSTYMPHKSAASQENSNSSGEDDDEDDDSDDDDE